MFAAGAAFESSQPTAKLGPLWDSEGDTVDTPELPSITVDIADADRCPRYGAALVSGVAVGPSPFVMTLIGIRTMPQADLSLLTGSDRCP